MKWRRWNILCINTYHVELHISDKVNLDRVAEIVKELSDK